MPSIAKFRSSRTKYRNQRTTVDDISFASKKEANRYKELKILERCGEIEDLILQPRFECFVNARRICRYTADFSYYDKRNSRRVIEDVKGIDPPQNKLRRKLAEAIHEIDVVLI